MTEKEPCTNCGAKKWDNVIRTIYDDSGQMFLQETWCTKCLRTKLHQEKKEKE